MKKIVFITPADARYGFSLAGVGQYTANAETVTDIFAEIIREPEMGLAIVDERLLTTETEEKLRDMERQWQGILLFLPSPDRREGKEEDYAARLMRRAIGYHVRLGM